MAQMTWMNLIIAAVIVTIVLLLLGTIWRILMKFIKLWLVVLVILVCLKLVTDAGWF